jgi:hypothetical protein
MRKFLIYWPVPLSVVAFAAATLAGECYKNTYDGTKPNCRWIGGGGLLPGGPCPWGPSFIPPFPSSCGGYTVNVRTPTGVSSNESTGEMNADYVAYTCKNTYICNKVIVAGGTILLPIYTMACTPGAPTPAATAWPLAATGGQCPAPDGTTKPPIIDVVDPVK